MEESVLALKCASIAHEELSRLCLGVRVCEGGPEPYCDEPIIDPSFLDGAMDSYNVAGAILDLKFDPGLRDRSEEHTSELQSLMRISYAVFCLKTKIHTSITPTTPLQMTTQ